MRKKPTADRFAHILFLAAVSILIFAYGVGVGKYELFPYRWLELAAEGYQELKYTRTNPFANKPVNHHKPPITYNAKRAYNGLNLVAKVAPNLHLSIELMDMNGRKVHDWDADWFDIWPDATHLPDHRLPKSKPGALVHGCLLMENGDVVFNYESCGLVRLDRRGKVVWRLPYQTHHSVERSSDGNLWVGGLKYYTQPNARFPRRHPPFYDDRILAVTPEGRIAEEWSVTELLRENGLAGLLEISSGLHPGTKIPDPIHLNDVEPFPADMKEGFFKKGDILVSLRNINTVFVFSRQNRKIKFISTGKFVRQHDPDFVDGNRFSVFDNNAPNSDPLKVGADRSSRIVMISAPDNSSEVVFTGSAKSPFFTNLMGKHQWLPNGNLLITETMKGRAFEVDPKGEVVWEYVNYISKGMIGVVTGVERLPLEVGRLFRDGGDAGESHSDLPPQQIKDSNPTVPR